jgi:hypothetical protein
MIRIEAIGVSRHSLRSILPDTATDGLATDGHFPLSFTAFDPPHSVTASGREIRSFIWRP